MVGLTALALSLLAVAMAWTLYWRLEQTPGWNPDRLRPQLEWALACTLTVALLYLLHLSQMQQGVYPFPLTLGTNLGLALLPFLVGLWIQRRR
ncbi:MAG: hypothetical protein H5T59_04500 [Anaerolineae bacterium]|nr:hypothetical protein [Anaerolineae bacterium]